MFLISLILLLLFIFFQDVLSRAVYWFLFPLLMVLCLAVNRDTLTLDWLWNIVFLIFMMVMLSLYVGVKEKRLVNITNGYFSWGDVLFLLAVTPLFTFQLYVLFFTAGTILTLLIHVTAMIFRKQETIPYAGYMSLALIPAILLKEPILQYLALYA